MLVITRTIGTGAKITTESGEEIKVYLVQIKGKQVRLGFAASEKCHIDRFNKSGSTEDRDAVVNATVKVKR